MLDFTEWLSNEILFSRAIWTGLYSGLYTVNKKGMVPKPTAECFGDWIVHDVTQLRDFRDDLLTNYFGVTLAEYRDAWQSTGDLMFKNFDSCYFKAVMEDVHTYCGT